MTSLAYTETVPLLSPCSSADPPDRHPETAEKGAPHFRRRARHQGEHRALRRRGRGRGGHGGLRHGRAEKPPRGQGHQDPPGRDSGDSVPEPPGFQERPRQRHFPGVHLGEAERGGRGPRGAPLRLLADLRVRGQRLGGRVAQLAGVHQLQLGAELRLPERLGAALQAPGGHVRHRPGGPVLIAPGPAADGTADEGRANI